MLSKKIDLWNCFLLKSCLSQSWHWLCSSFHCHRADFSYTWSWKHWVSDSWKASVPENPEFCFNAQRLLGSNLARIEQRQSKIYGNGWFLPTFEFTLFEIFIFCPKIQLWFPEKIIDFLGWKTRENVGVLDFLVVDSLDFTRKIHISTFAAFSRLKSFNLVYPFKILHRLNNLLKVEKSWLSAYSSWVSWTISQRCCCTEITAFRCPNNFCPGNSKQQL